MKHLTNDSRARRGWRKACLASAALAAGAWVPAARADLSGFGDFTTVNTYQDASNTNPSGDGFVGGSLLQLTTGGNTGQATSTFANTKQSIGSFIAKFTYYPQYSGSYAADGMTFTVQNDPAGLAAIGAAGGSLAYGSDGTHPAITNSAAFGFNLFSGYQSNNTGIGTWSYGTNGTLMKGQPYFNDFGLLYRNAPVDVTLSYAGGALTATLRDSQTANVYSFSTPALNIPQLVGGSTAYVGFTGATGGITATQYITNFKYAAVTAAYNPIGVTGFNTDSIVEAGATNFQTAVSATMDNGNSRDGSGNLGGATWYQVGFNTAAPTTGLPAGTTFTSMSDPNHKFSLAAATGNNGVLLNSANTAGSLKLTSPGAFSALSFLTSTGSGSGAFDITIHHTTGADEVITGVASSDWFDSGGVAYEAAGRVNPDLTTDSVGSTDPRLYQFDVALTDTTDPISSIDLSYASGSGNTIVYGISGVATATPEPTALGLLGLGALAAVRRSRSRRGGA